MELGTFRYYCWNALLCILLIGTDSLGMTLPPSDISINFHPEVKLPERGSEQPHHRKARSPFIMAFQVTKPPGMFSMSLRRPYFFNMMSNLTRSLFSSPFSEMIRRGFSQLSQTNSTVVDQIRSRQEDLEIFDN